MNHFKVVIKEVLEEWCISRNWLYYATSTRSADISVASRSNLFFGHARSMSSRCSLRLLSSAYMAAPLSQQGRPKQQGRGPGEFTSSGEFFSPQMAQVPFITVIWLELLTWLCPIHGEERF